MCKLCCGVFITIMLLKHVNLNNSWFEAQNNDTWKYWKYQYISTKFWILSIRINISRTSVKSSSIRIWRKKRGFLFTNLIFQSPKKQHEQRTAGIIKLETPQPGLKIDKTQHPQINIKLHHVLQLDFLLLLIASMFQLRLC